MFKENKAIIFDMDGVITNTMPYHYRCWKEIFRKNNLLVSRFDVYSREGQKGIESVIEIFKEKGKTISLKKAEEILKEKERRFKKIVKKRFIVGSKTFLKELSLKGFKLGLVTGTSRKEIHKILPSNMYNLFSVIITGTDVHKGKPHPEPYLKCLKKLHLKPCHCLVVENAPFGIQSAKKAKIPCVALTTSLPKKYLKESDWIVSSIKELRKMIFK